MTTVSEQPHPKQMGIRLSRAEDEALSRAAAAAERPKASMVRWIVRRYLRSVKLLEPEIPQ